MQRALIQYRDPKKYDLVMEALKITGRMDLVGFGEKCLIRPRKLQSEKNDKKSVKNDKKPIKKKAIRNVHKRKG